VRVIHETYIEMGGGSGSFFFAHSKMLLSDKISKLIFICSQRKAANNHAII
jgi:hypothetical protein